MVSSLSFYRSLLTESAGLGPGDVVIPTDFPAIDRVRQFFKCSAGLVDRDEWCEQLVDGFCLLGGLDRVDGQADFFATFDERFSEVVEWFLQSVTPEEHREIGRLRKESWRLVQVKKFLELRCEKAVRVDPAPAASAATVEVHGGGLVGLSLLQALPQWAALLPAARQVFTFMYRRAHRSTTAAQPWCQISVGLVMKVTGYRERQVERALAQLRRDRWIGYVVRGRPQIGGSRYWVATSPVQIGVALTGALLKKLAFKP